MCPSKLSILLSALVLGAIAGCATPSSQGEPTSGAEQNSPGGGTGSTGAPASAPTSSTGSGEPSGTTQTPDERRDAIDRRLNDSLGTFDAELRKEQEGVAQERDAREAAGTAATDESDATEEGEGEPGSADGENPVVASADSKDGDNTARPGDLKSDKDRAGSSSGAASGSGATARDIPDGSDDDIVARRLRKAAEQETDPELKDKLWKEYIEYKKNAGT